MKHIFFSLKLKTFEISSYIPQYILYGLWHPNREVESYTPVQNAENL